MKFVKNRLLSILLPLLLMPLQSAVSASPELTCSPFPANKECPRQDVSIIELIANGSSFHDRLVRVEGFMNIEFEGRALYLHKEDWSIGLLKNSLSVDLLLEELGGIGGCRNRSYVLLEGTFDAKNQGLRSGGMKKITRCVSLE
jgi:hypothetical protein